MYVLKMHCEMYTKTKPFMKYTFIKEDAQTASQPLLELTRI